MELYTALDDFKRSQGDPRRFAGERRSTVGLFSGLDGRLVHVAPNGSIRDYSYPLSGRTGIERSRFGLELAGTVHWFEDGTQRYVDDTAVVETTYAVDGVTVRQFDLTLDELHLTHVVVDDSPDDAADVEGTTTLHACLGPAPEGRLSRVGQLRHGDAAEVYHDEERTAVAASGPVSFRGELTERFEELVRAEPTEFPRAREQGRYEDDRLTPILWAEVDLEGSQPSGTVVTHVSGPDTEREAALDTVRDAAAHYPDRASLVEAGRDQASDRFPAAPVDGAVDDLRALWLLRAPSGARIAGPEFDPFTVHSGGYGYTWFRDDAEIAQFLFAADRRADLGLDGWHADSVRFYVETQLADGTWPHRVWPRNGRLAPGWAHGRIEEAESADFQADQTASVAAFLATYLRVADPSDDPVADDSEDRIRETLAAALDGLDSMLGDDGLPVECQNAWENMTGRFTHTAATFLEAYAAIARAPIDEALRTRARVRAADVAEALDALWLADEGYYAMRIADGELDDRLDGGTLALASAFGEYDAVADVDADQLDRLVSHVGATFDGLGRDPDGPVEGLARFEGDPWRRSDQDEPKVWSVTTAWGAHAAVELRDLLRAHDRPAADRFDESARTLLALVGPESALRHDGGYFSEQVFDDGTPDSATPLGWPHAIRLATECALDAQAPVEGTTEDRTATTD